MSEAQSRLRIGIAGGGPRCLSYVRSLVQIDRAQVVAADPHHPLAIEVSRLVPGLALKQDALTLISSPNVDAVLFSEPVGDLLPLLKRALLSNKHIMASSASSISSRQLRELSRLAGKQARLLMFAEERLFHPALVFLRRMLSGKSGLWHPQYLRALSIPGTSNGNTLPIASLALEELALCARLIDAHPETVSAVASHAPGHPEPVAVFLNLTYGEGKVAALQISLAEAQEARQWVFTTVSKTALVDECDPRAPLRIISSNSAAIDDSLLRADPPVPLSDWPGESTITPPVVPADPTMEQCLHFVESALGRDLNRSNARFWSDVASTWEAAEQSMALSGMPVNVAAALGSGQDQARGRPKLRLIRGRGIGSVGDGKRPALTVVSR